MAKTYQYSTQKKLCHLLNLTDFPSFKNVSSSFAENVTSWAKPVAHSLTHAFIYFLPAFRSILSKTATLRRLLSKNRLFTKIHWGPCTWFGNWLFPMRDEKLNLESTYSVLTIPFPLKRLILFEIWFPTFLFVVFFVFSCINTSPLLACMTLSKWTEASSQQINSLIDSVVVCSWLAFHFHEEWHTPR